MPLEEILRDGWSPRWATSGLYGADEIFVPETLVSARAVWRGLGCPGAALAERRRASHVEVAIGAVKAELHHMGRNLSTIFLEGCRCLGKDLGELRFTDRRTESDDPETARNQGLLRS